MTLLTFLAVLTAFSSCRAYESDVNPITNRKVTGIDRWMLQEDGAQVLWWRSKFWPPRIILATQGNPTGAGWLYNGNNEFIAPARPDITISKGEMMNRFKMPAYMTIMDPFGAHGNPEARIFPIPDTGEGWPFNDDDILKTGYEVKDNQLKRSSSATSNFIPRQVFVPSKLDPLERSRQPVLTLSQCFRLWGKDMEQHDVMMGDALFEVDGWPPLMPPPPPPPPISGLGQQVRPRPADRPPPALPVGVDLPPPRPRSQAAPQKGVLNEIKASELQAQLNKIFKDPDRALAAQEAHGSVKFEKEEPKPAPQERKLTEKEIAEMQAQERLRERLAAEAAKRRKIFDGESSSSEDD